MMKIGEDIKKKFSFDLCQKETNRIYGKFKSYILGTFFLKDPKTAKINEEFNCLYCEHRVKRVRSDDGFPCGDPRCKIYYMNMKKLISDY